METFKKYLKHPKMWIYALMGKSMPVTIPEGQVTYQSQQSTNPTTPAATIGAKPMSPDDPLHQDLEKAISLLKTITAKLPKVSLPIPSKPVVPQDSQLSQISELVKPNKLKNILPIFVVGIVVLILVVAGVVFIVPYIKNLQKPKVNPIVITEPSPTPIEQPQTQPSIYANDPDILKLEEDINVLDREVVGTQLREPTLNAPVLDFNISF